MQNTTTPTLILGGGPSGLMAAWELAKAGKQVILLEQNETVGGQCRTETLSMTHGDYRFDYGGHRFITHNYKLLRFVERLMGDELLIATRKSVIRFQGRTYDYPLSVSNLLKTAPIGLLWGSIKDLLLPSGVKDAEESFESWMKSRFGNNLYQHFFYGYTKKLWGIEPSQLSADWASQRISLINLYDVLKRLLGLKKKTVRTYASIYRYPKFGIGQLFQQIGEDAKINGAQILCDHKIQSIKTEAGKITEVEVLHKGEIKRFSAENIISTLPLPDMVKMTGGVSELGFRSLRFLNVALQMKDLSDNTWQYLSDELNMGTRLQEPKRRSHWMTPPGRTSIMLEIPCNVGDDIWTADDASLLQRASEDLLPLGVNLAEKGRDYFTTREEHAYPLLDVSYREKRQEAIDHLNQFSNLIMCGRQGTFRYIFMDTAMEMGQMAAQSILEAKSLQDSIYNHRNEKTVIETQSVV